jgi:cell division protein FtsA
VENGTNLRILGVGIEPSQGIRRGTVSDMDSAAQSIARSIEKAERTSGYEINSALVSLAGSHVTSMNSRGVVGISGRVIDQDDLYRAWIPQAVPFPTIAKLQSSCALHHDGRTASQAIGIKASEWKLEAHIITASATAW